MVKSAPLFWILRPSSTEKLMSCCTVTVVPAGSVPISTVSDCCPFILTTEPFWVTCTTPVTWCASSFPRLETTAVTVRVSPLPEMSLMPKSNFTNAAAVVVVGGGVVEEVVV